MNMSCVLSSPVCVVESGTVGSCTTDGIEDGGGWAVPVSVFHTCYIVQKGVETILKPSACMYVSATLDTRSKRIVVALE